MLGHFSDISVSSNLAYWPEFGVDINSHVEDLDKGSLPATGKMLAILLRTRTRAPSS